MHVHLKPIVAQQVALAPRVPKAAPPPPELPEVKSVAERLDGSGRRDPQKQHNQRRDERDREIDAEIPRDPAASLASTLAALYINGATSKNGQ